MRYINYSKIIVNMILNFKLSIQILKMSYYSWGRKMRFYPKEAIIKISLMLCFAKQVLSEMIMLNNIYNQSIIRIIFLYVLELVSFAYLKDLKWSYYVCCYVSVVFFSLNGANMLRFSLLLKLCSWHCLNW